jgi:hypothetical protein
LLLAEYAGSFSKEWPAAATTGLGPDFTLEWSALPSATYVVVGVHGRVGFAARLGHVDRHAGVRVSREPAARVD